MKIFIKWLISTIAQHYIGILITLISGATVSIIWQKRIVGWLSDKTLIQNWVLAALILLIFLLLGSTSFTLYKYLKKPKPFKPFLIYEKIMNVYWKIKNDPRHWADIDASSSSPNYIDSLIAGPFCSECKSQIATKDSIINSECELGGHKTSDGFKNIQKDEVKKFVIMALQRYMINRKKIQENMIFSVLSNKE